MKFKPRTILIAFVALILSHAEISRAGWVLNDKLTAYPAIAKEKFGCSVATDGNWLAVGATDTLVGRFRATGAVHIFERVGDNWFFRQTLFNPKPASFQAFGNSIALRQDHLVVGSWGSDTFAGRAFVYTRDAAGLWALSQTLEASDPQEGKPALFGWSVSLDMPATGSGVIAVGRVNDSEASTGAVYVFEGRNDSWSEVAKLTASDATKSDQLGTNISVRNGTIIAGVPRRRVAYVFSRSLINSQPVWSQAAKLTPISQSIGDNFGYSVASGGNFVAVGAPSRVGDDGETRAGAVTIFYAEGNIWREGSTVLQLTARTQNASDSFGYSVGVAPLPNSSQCILVASAPSRDSPLSNSGAAFAFRGAGNSWTIDTSDLWTTTGLVNQNIGKALGISADGSVVALATDGPTNSPGGAFPFVFNEAGSTDTGTVGGGSSDGSSSGGSSSGGSSSGGTTSDGSSSGADSSGGSSSGGTTSGGSSSGGTTSGGSSSGGTTSGGSSSGGTNSGGSSSGGTTSGGSSSGGSSSGGANSDGSSTGGGPGDNLGAEFGSGGKIRSMNSLPPLYNKLGQVSDTVFAQNSISQAMYGLQITYGDNLESTIRASTKLLCTYPDNLRLVEVADCDGDGGSDLLWQDRVTNQVILWTRDGSKILSKKVLITPGPGVKAVAAYDIQDKGGAANIILLNAATSTINVLTIYDGAVVSTDTLTMPSGGWRPVPFAFIPNSVLIRNPSTGELRRITLADTGVASRTILVDSPPANYEIQAIGDIDSDGQNDIVARSEGEDQVRFYMMDGNKISQVCTGLTTAHWNVVGMQDWDGNGVNDLLVNENGGDRRIVVLYMEVKSYVNGSVSIPQIKGNQVLGRLGMGTVVGLGPR